MIYPSVFDYSCIFTISAGFNLAYIALDKYKSNQEDGKVFFRLLYKSVNLFEKDIKKRADDNLKQVTVLQPQLEFNLNNGLFSESEKGIISSVKTELSKVDYEVKKIVDEKNIDAKESVKTEYFSTISFISALFSILILLVSPYEKTYPVTAIIIVFSMLPIFVSILWLFFLEFIKPRWVSIILIAGIIVLFGCLCVFSDAERFVYAHRGIIAAIISMVGFILYFIKCKGMLWLLRLRFNKELNKVYTDVKVNTLRNQIKNIENQLIDPNPLDETITTNYEKTTVSKI